VFCYLRSCFMLHACLFSVLFYVFVFFSFLFVKARRGYDKFYAFTSPTLLGGIDVMPTALCACCDVT
jgi:hypothetical protein